MEPVKGKLRDLRIYLPGEQAIVYMFGRFLTVYLNPELTPEGFNLAAEIALNDLQTGVSSISGQSIRGDGRYPTEIASRHPRVWADFRNRIPDIARAVCPTDFAEGVRKAYEQVKT